MPLRFTNIFSATRAPFQKRTGGGDPDAQGVDYAWSNNFFSKARNAADSADQALIGLDSNDVVQVADQCIKPALHTFTFKLAANGSLASQQFFIAPYAMRVTAITEVHSAAANDAAAVTAYIEKLTGTTAVGSGVAMCSALSMKSTANTVQSATLATAHPNADGVSQDIYLAAGDRVAIVFSGVLTTLAGVVLTITATPGFKGETVVFNMNANAGIVDQAFYVAPRPVVVTGAYWVHGTKGTDGSAVTAQVVKDTGTDAPGAGTDLLSSAFNLKAANNTVQTGTLVTTAGVTTLAVGDRLSLDVAGTTTALAGAVLVVTLRPMYSERHISFNMNANGDLADQAFWIADRDYEIISAMEVQSTAGSDGSAVTLQLTIDSGTNAPGAGIDTLTLNTNAGWSLKSTANTPVVGTFVSRGYLVISAGNRLSLDFAGTLTAVAGVVVTVALKPI